MYTLFMQFNVYKAKDVPSSLWSNPAQRLNRSYICYSLSELWHVSLNLKSQFRINSGCTIRFQVGSYELKNGKLTRHSRGVEIGSMYKTATDSSQSCLEATSGERYYPQLIFHNSELFIICLWPPRFFWRQKYRRQ